MHLPAVSALIPDGIGIPAIQIPAKTIERDGRPLTVPAADHTGRLGEVVDSFPQAVLELPRECPGHLEPFGIGEDRALFNEIPEQDHHVRVVVVGAGEWVVFVFEAFLIDGLNLFSGRCIREREPQRLSCITLAAGHVIHRHVFADAVPAKVTNRAIASGGIPDFIIEQITGRVHSFAELDVGHPAERQRIVFHLSTLDPRDQSSGRSFNAIGITASGEYCINAVTERIMKGTHHRPAGPRILQIQQRKIAAVQLLNHCIRRTVAKQDEILLQRNVLERIFIGDDGELDLRSFENRCLDGLRFFRVSAAPRRDNGGRAFVLADQRRGDVEFFQTLNFRRLWRRRDSWRLDAGDELDAANEE